MNRTIHTIRISLIILIVICFALTHPGGAAYPDGDYEAGMIIDGAAFILSDGTKVRLIGIEAPGPGEYCSDQAQQRLSSLIYGRSVYLERGVSETDSYGNLLRYVHVGGSFVNLTLVSEGYVRTAISSPDVRYASLLTGAEESARESRRGCLWSSFLGDDTKGYLELNCFISVVIRGFLSFHNL